MFYTKLVAILNVTPNSFSDGGLYLNPAHAKKHLESLLQHKPSAIDIGAISTRPNSIQPLAEEEILRYEQILPVIAPILKNSLVEVSIDSYNFETIEYLAKHIPIHWINDQKGFIDEKLIDLAKKLNCKVVIMHHLTIPADPNVLLDTKANIIQEVKEWLFQRAESLLKKGIKQDKIILDPGIGFNKTAQQSWTLIREAAQITNLGFAVMYGHSRKSFLNTLTDKDFCQRDLETAIITSYLAQKRVEYVRIHNMETNLQALKIQAMLGENNG